MRYTKESLLGLCKDILGKIDEERQLPNLVEDAAIALFRCNVRSDELCLELRVALKDLYVYGEFRFDS